MTARLTRVIEGVLARGGAEVPQKLPSGAAGNEWKAMLGDEHKKVHEHWVHTTTARLTKETRRKLMLASQAKDFTEKISVRGPVPEADQDDLTCKIRLSDGQKVSAPALRRMALATRSGRASTERSAWPVPEIAFRAAVQTARWRPATPGLRRRATSQAAPFLTCLFLWDVIIASQ